MIKEGKVVRTIMRSFKMDEISGVDRPAQVEAKAAIMKRDSVEKVMASMALTTMTGGHAHLITMGGGDYLRRAGQTDYVDGHSHPWLMDEAGNLTVGHAQGHNHGIEILAKGEASPDALKRLMSPNGKPAPAGDLTKTGSTAENNGTTQDQTMTPEEKLAAEQAAVAKKQADETIANLQKRAERAEKVASLSDSHRAHFRLLKGADADAFVAASDSERDETIRKAAESNQVVYTAMNGTVYRKNDDERLVKMAQELDAEKKKRMAADAAACKADLEKRAGELAHIPGSLDVRVSLLKGIDSLPEAERAEALKALKAQNERMAGAFKQVGTSESPTGGDDGLDPLDKMAADIAKRDGCSFELAYTKALDTPEGQKHYNKHVAARAER